MTRIYRQCRQRLRQWQQKRALEPHPLARGANAEKWAEQDSYNELFTAQMLELKEENRRLRADLNTTQAHGQRLMAAVWLMLAASLAVLGLAMVLLLRR